MSVVHELKTWPVAFEPTLNRSKRCEIRVDDRDFEEGDILWLREWHPEFKSYTGRQLRATVTHVVKGRFGLPPDLCVMSIDVPRKGWLGE